MTKFINLLYTITCRTANAMVPHQAESTKSYHKDPNCSHSKLGCNMRMHNVLIRKKIDIQ